MQATGNKQSTDVGKLMISVNGEFLSTIIHIAGSYLGYVIVAYVDTYPRCAAYYNLVPLVQLASQDPGYTGSLASMNLKQTALHWWQIALVGDADFYMKEE